MRKLFDFFRLIFASSAAWMLSAAPTFAHSAQEFLHLHSEHIFINVVLVVLISSAIAWSVLK